MTAEQQKFRHRGVILFTATREYSGEEFQELVRRGLQLALAQDSTCDILINTVELEYNELDVEEDNE